MLKKLSLSLIALAAMVMFGAGCGSSDGGGTVPPIGASPTITGEICAAFPSDWVAEASGKEIIKTGKSTIPSVSDCEYYLTVGVGGSGKRIDLVHEHLDIEIQKKARDIAGSKWENGSGFAMDAVLLYNSKGDITDVDILLGANEYLRINSLSGALTGDELVAFGKKVADRIKSGQAHGSDSSAETSKDTSNPTGTADAKGVTQSFFDAISRGNLAAAVDLMDANQTTKNMWKQNFAVISSLSVKSIEPVYQSEWTADTEKYKATLDVKVSDPDTELWSNGSNSRWVTLRKSGGKWLVNELANNP
ncbi:MAG: hypothetical protein ACOYUZ_06635 [Patescibacteria group bacterium]